MNNKIFLGLFLSLTSFQLQAEDLSQVFELAKQNDPTYGAAVAEYQAAVEASPKAWANVKPQINLSGEYSEIIDENSTSSIRTIVDDNYDNQSYALKLTQTLYNKSQFDAIAQADALVAQAEAVYGNARYDLILRVAQSYFDVLSESASLVFAKAEKKAIAQQLDQAKQRFKVGLTAITDVLEAQARYDQAVSSEIEAQRLLDLSNESLREITGQAHGELHAVKANLKLVSPDPNDMEAWVKTALERNLLLLSAEQAVNAAREGKDLAYAGHYPILNFEASYADREQNGGTFPFASDGTTLSLQLNIPIYSGGGTNAAGREAAALYQQSKQLYETQRRATERLTRNSYLTVLSAISQVNALKQSVRSSQSALEATQAGFEVGTRTAVDVLDSQRELYLAQRNYIRARHAYIVNTLQLKQAAGTLMDEDMTLINAWLDATP